jgi:hypothetical protein
MRSTSASPTGSAPSAHRAGIPRAQPHATTIGANGVARDRASLASSVVRRLQPGDAVEHDPRIGDAGEAGRPQATQSFRRRRGPSATRSARARPRAVAGGAMLGAAIWALAAAARARVLGIERLRRGVIPAASARGRPSASLLRAICSASSAAACQA